MLSITDLFGIVRAQRSLNYLKDFPCRRSMRRAFLDQRENTPQQRPLLKVEATEPSCPAQGLRVSVHRPASSSAFCRVLSLRSSQALLGTRYTAGTLDNVGAGRVPRWRCPCLTATNSIR
jgi:hypothetical protein